MDQTQTPSRQSPSPTFSQSPRQAFHSYDKWAEGDIAFLLPSHAYSPEERNYVITSQRVGEKATGHPVIILQLGAKYAMVTTVSAYTSPGEKGLRAPWNKPRHRHKGGINFRSFDGTEQFKPRDCPHPPYPALFLEPDAETGQENRMPKDRESWVYIQSVFVVPVTVLGWFDKPGKLLRVQKGSLESLKDHMATGCLVWRQRQRELLEGEERAREEREREAQRMEQERAKQQWGELQRAEQQRREQQRRRAAGSVAENWRTSRPDASAASAPPSAGAVAGNWRTSRSDASAASAPPSAGFASRPAQRFSPPPPAFINNLEEFPALPPVQSTTPTPTAATAS